MIWIFDIVIIGFAIWLKLHLKDLRGAIGERFIAKKLRQLDKTHYLVLNDIYLPSHGRTNNTQIDHVVISNYGIFVIETKAFSGNIYGGSHSKEWTRYLRGHNLKFYNPIYQNFAHIQSIKSLLGPLYAEVPIESLVTFPMADKLKIHDSENVGSGKEIIAKIKGFTKVVISDFDKDRIYKILLDVNITDRAVRRRHKLDVQAINKLSNI